MKISVIVSSYNGEEYIIEQLESLCNQTHQPDEVLIFDDGSKDNTIQLVNNFINLHQLSGWKLITNSVNKGWRKNFIDGIASAAGDLIFPCDQDDIWQPDKLEVMHKIMTEHSEIELLTSNYCAFYDNGTTAIRPGQNDDKLEKRSAMKKLFETPYPGCTYCIRRSLVQRGLPYWEEGFPHDALFWRIATFSGTAYSINKPLIRWRRHESSTYTKESIQSKTYQNKREWLDYAERVVISLQKYLNANEMEASVERDILLQNQKWIIRRKLFYDNKKIRDGLRLIRYLKIYPHKRQYLGDWYLIFFKK